MARGGRIPVTVRKGQIRVIEAVLAVFMVVAVILLLMQFTRPLRSAYIRETSDLRRLGYNLLNSMAENNVYEKVLGDLIYEANRCFSEGGGCPEGWEGNRLDELAFFATIVLPQGLLFRVDVYTVHYSLTEGRVVLCPLGYAANFNAEIEPMKEAEPIIYTYVCTGDPDRVRGSVLFVHLTIGYSG